MQLWKNSFMKFTVMVVCLLSPCLASADSRSLVSELRLGYLAHDIDAVSFNREDGWDMNAEILFRPLGKELVGDTVSIYPHLGASMNTKGDTSQAYLGLTLRRDLAKKFFAEAMFGGAVHDGHLDLEKRDRKALGARWLFRLGAAIGYNFTEHINTSLVYDHVSNAELKSANEGLDTLGIKLGYRF
jgi:lipid A 3-O-deacylase